MSDKKDGEQLDARAAEKAFDALEPTLLAIPSEQFAARTLDRKRAAMLTWRVARELKKSSLRGRLSSLPAAEFDNAQVSQLETAALALWHTTVSAESALAQSSGTHLPTTLVEEASAVKRRMLKLVQYLFGDNPVDGTEIADIVAGVGYLDLATDLVRLAKLYEKHDALVKKDPKHFVAGDAKEARHLSNTILKTLGEQQSADAARWGELETRALTHLARLYNDVALTVRWLQRNDTTGDRFDMPPLYAASRRSRAPKPPADETPTPTPPSPAGTAP